MDDKTLKKLVEEVGVVLDNSQVGHNGRTLPKIKTKKVIKIIENEFGEEEEIEEIKDDINLTLPWVLKELKPINKLCEIGCGKVATNQIIDRKLYQSPVRHWRTICRSCQKARLPDGTLITGNANIQNAYFKYYNYGKDK